MNTLEKIQKKDYTAKIGNLICLEEEYNNSLGSKRISAKILCYQKSCFNSAQEVANFVTDDWSKKEIEERSVELSSKLYGMLWDKTVIGEQSEKELLCV